ncbi:MAG: lyase family protein [Candidatus Melainabacteria bacterium]|nr:lyase family protein [Candidatus Melainabacteria bacterium]
MASRKGHPRTETDEFGDVTIPAGCYWGVGTARAIEFFAATGRPTHPALIEAIAQVKKAVAITNGELGQLDRKTVSAITQVCDEILSGQWRDQIVVDAFHGGAGIGLIVNINELIANRACEILGDPVDAPASVSASRHVNLSQSTADVYTTAMRIAIMNSLKKLQVTVIEMERLLRRKSLEFERIVKVGRTSLRDDAPVTLGQEFNCYGSMIEHALRRIKDAGTNLEEINLGGRSVGTGFNTAPEFAAAATRNLAQVTNLSLRPAEDYFRLTQSMSDFAALSSSLRDLAVDLVKIAGDLKLMSSGPSAGFSEIKLSDSLLSSSTLWAGVMPKVAIPPLTELLIMVCYEVMGNDHAVCLSAQAGQLEANALTPAIIDNILMSISTMQKALSDFNHHCLIKITADTARCKELLDKSGAMIAALTTEVGYEQTLDIIDQAKAQGQDVREYLINSKVLPRPTLDKIFHYKFLTTPHLLKPGKPQENSEDDSR